MEKNDNEIGALWLKEAKSGTKYMAGVVNGENIVIFKNNNKKSDKSPDYYILKNEPKTQNTKKSNNAEKINNVFNDEDIPF